ncbi:MAG: DUF72 domain-containing protein [Dongiaceae bacterium]
MTAVPAGAIRIGVGGWIYPPWRGSFYPQGLPRTRELGFATRRLATIEISATFFGAQRVATFRSWAAAAPDGFVYAVKGPRAATHRGDLAEVGPLIERFIRGGVLELGSRLGPLLWQLPDATPFDPEQFGRFLALLPQRAGGRALRHVVEVRNVSFHNAAVVRLLRDHGVALAILDSERSAAWEDLTADFVYLRLQRCAQHEVQGYARPTLEHWADRLRAWSLGRAAPRPALLGPPAAMRSRDVYAYFVGGFKQRCPTAALALQQRIGALPEQPPAPGRDEPARAAHG